MVWYVEGEKNDNLVNRIWLRDPGRFSNGIIWVNWGSGGWSWRIRLRRCMVMRIGCSILARWTRKDVVSMFCSG